MLAAMRSGERLSVCQRSRAVAPAPRRQILILVRQRAT
jgi:hypothetical protein